MATVLTHEADVPSDSRLTFLHVGHTAVTHGMMRDSMDSTTLKNDWPSPISTDAYEVSSGVILEQCRQHVIVFIGVVVAGHVLRLLEYAFGKAGIHLGDPAVFLRVTSIFSSSSNNNIHQLPTHPPI